MVRVLLYWSAITFLPVVLLAAGYTATKASQLISTHASVAGLVVLLDVTTSLVMGIMVLTCVYKFLPNTHVPFRSALIGAAVVVPLWILARWGFALYVQIVAKGSVYGALGLLPLFLVWINYSWLAFLFGAELAYTWANLRRLQLDDESKHILLGPMDMLAAALVVGEAYTLARRPVRYREIVDRLAMPDISVQSLLERLSEAGVICLVAAPAGEGDAYVPARPLESIRAQDVLTLDMAQTEGPQKDKQLAEALRKIKAMTQDAVGDVTLLQLLPRKP
jgi:membrane protein